MGGSDSVASVDGALVKVRDLANVMTELEATVEERTMVWISRVLLYDDAISEGLTPKAWVPALAEVANFGTAKRGLWRELGRLIVDEGLEDTLEVAWRLGGVAAAHALLGPLIPRAKIAQHEKRRLTGGACQQQEEREQKIVGKAYR